jgi:flagellar basal body-associated protein FliL
VVDKKSEAKEKSGVSVLVLSLCCVASILLGLVGGVFGGSSIKAALGIEQGGVQVVTADQIDGALDGDLNDPSSLFAPMPGVFDPDKERFYADAGEFLVAIKYQGRTRYLQLTAQLVGHDEEFMGKVETDVPAIRNGLSIFFTQQDFSVVSTLEGRETLRLATLIEINKIIGATAELRVADVYFTDYITQ